MRRAPGTRVPSPTPPDSARAGVERRSSFAVAYLHQLPRWLLFLVVLGLAITAIFAPPPIGGIALLVIAVFLAWLGYLSWPALTPAARLVRVASVVIVVGAGIVSLD